MKISEELLRESFRCGELGSKLPIFVFETTQSTNGDAREFARSNETDRALFIAARQTRGRGRLDRHFVSEPGGLYMSLLFRLDANPCDATQITAYAAVIAREAIEELTGIQTQIKWVNDIVKDEKKLCGILTEGILCPDTGRLKYVIVGFGVNVLGKSLHSDIADIATSLELLGASLRPETLASRITELFLQGLDKIGTKKCTEEYRRHSSLIGKEVTVFKSNSSYPAAVLGISDKCELILRLQDGTEELLSTGEVSVRVK